MSSIREKQALMDVNVDIPEKGVMAFIGPSGCGKSTFLRCINRMNDTIPGCRVTGKWRSTSEDIYDPKLDVVQLRARVGMVFQKPNPFPKSIFENVAYGPRIHGLATSKSELEEIVDDEPEAGRPVRGGEGSPARLRHQPVGRPAAAPVHRPRDRGGPEIILMDEPCSALDPIATAKIEELMDELMQNYTIVIVTHSMQQAARVSQRTAFFHLGDLVEEGPTEAIFNNPKERRTQDYITGRFG